jgi:hypothetical protein
MNGSSSGQPLQRRGGLWYSLILVTPMLIGASGGVVRGDDWFVASYVNLFLISLVSLFECFFSSS